MTTPTSKSEQRDAAGENEIRLYANELMRQLYELGAREQLRILEAYARACIALLDKDPSNGG